MWKNQTIQLQHHNSTKQRFCDVQIVHYTLNQTSLGQRNTFFKAEIEHELAMQILNT